MRVLGRIRLSRLTDESTSASRQRDVIEQWAAANQHEIIGWAEDLDVSGSVDPFDTPALGGWLTEERSYDWDAVAAWKLDRFGRDAIRLNKLFGWCLDNHKTLVSCSEGIDLSTPVGRLIANVIAFLAEGELEAIRERVSASHRKLRELGRWPGGKPTYGYLARERVDEPGWELVLDEHAAGVVASIVDSVLGGQPLDGIARALTARGEPAPSDYLRQRNQKPVRGTPWHRQTLTQLLRSKTLLGYVTHEGRTVRDRQGLPILKGPPLVTQERFDELQAALDHRARWQKGGAVKASPMLGVALCGGCDSPLHYRSQRANAKTYRYYYCPRGHRPQIPAETVEKLVEETFLDELGASKQRDRVFKPAESHQAELDEAVRAVDEITPLLGTVTSTTLRSRLMDQLSALNNRLTVLESMPVKEAGWEYRETGKTYAEAWAEADTQARRQLLLKSGITAAVRLHSGKALEFELRVPEDIRERLSA